MTGLLIFDLDGTLIDSVPDLAVAVNAMLDELGYEQVDESVVRGWVGNGSFKLVERALLSVKNTVDETTDDQTTMATITTMGALSDVVQMAHKVFLRHYGALCDGELCAMRTVPYAGVDNGLWWLRSAGFELALVTNKPMRFVPKLLGLFGWEDLFSVVFGGDSLAVKKPDPLPLLMVCERLGVNVCDAVMIGDSKNDVLAGQSAGMATVGLTYGYNYGEPITMSEPTWVFDEFGGLVEHLLSSIA